MLNVKKILFPTDQSASAAQAARHAAFLADWHKAELHAVRVLEEADISASRHRSDDAFAEELMANWDGAPPTAVRQLEAVSAPEGILRYARQEDIELVVMGTQGRRGARRLMAGSVAEAVVRRADCPVLTVRAKGEEGASSRATVRRVLAPVDFFDFTKLAVRYAVELAQTYGARIDLLYVANTTALPAPYGAAAAAEDVKVLSGRAHEALANIAREEIGYEDVRAAVEVGHPAACITDYAAEHEIDLIIIPTHGRTGLKRFLIGSVAEKVVRTAPCPVFVVKSFGKRLVAPREPPEEDASNVFLHPAARASE